MSVSFCCRIIGFLLFPVLVYGASLLDGERLYNNGLLPSGRHVEAEINGDISVSGAQLACVSCHRRSRLGSSEGQIQVPPLDFDSLYSGHSLSTNEQRGVAQQGAETRFVYTDDLLARAIITGTKPDGQPLDNVMPRYQLNDEAMRNLIAYIKSFRAKDDPSVTETELHIATVFSDEDPAAARLMTTVLEEFFHDKNANVRHETRRATHTPWTREWWYKSYRKIVLHQWSLTGPQDTWGDQLKSYLIQQPIFAMVSGLASNWRAIDAFCETNKIPCLLPNIIQPPETTGYYTRYFYPGLTMEAKVMAKLITPEQPLPNIIQLYDDRELSHLSAHAFTNAINNSAQLATYSVQDFISKKHKINANGVTRTAVYWGGQDQLTTKLINKLQAEQIGRLCLSATLVTDVEAVQSIWPGELCVVSPYRFKNRRFDDTRTLSWLHRKGLAESGDRRLKFNTYYAAKLISDAIVAIRGNFSRDFFIEKIEHMVDKSLIKPEFAHISSGPGQRYLTRGAYGLELDNKTGKLSIGHDWTIPD